MEKQAIPPSFQLLSVLLKYLGGVPTHTAVMSAVASTQPVTRSAVIADVCQKVPHSRPIVALRLAIESKLVICGEGDDPLCSLPSGKDGKFLAFIQKALAASNDDKWILEAFCFDSSLILFLLICKAYPEIVLPDAFRTIIADLPASTTIQPIANAVGIEASYLNQRALWLVERRALFRYVKLKGRALQYALVPTTKIPGYALDEAQVLLKGQEYIEVILSELFTFLEEGLQALESLSV